MQGLNVVCRVSAILAVALALAACASEPSTDQPETNLESLTITTATTGQDVLDRVSEAEGECFRTAVGEDPYEAFLDGGVLADYGSVGDLDPLHACLTGDNFVLFGVAFTSARAGISAESHACLTTLGREHPDAVVTFLGVDTPPPAVAELTSEEHPYTIELFNCLTTEEKSGVIVHTWKELGAYQFTGEQLIAAFTEEEVGCFTDSFGMTREQLVDLIGARQPGQTSDVATPCITDQTYGRLSAHMLSIQLGGLTEETTDCLQDFAVEHPHFFELTRFGEFDPSAMSQEEFVEIADDGLRLFNCLTDDELRLMQRASAVALASFGQ